MKKELELETGARSHPFVQAKAKAEAAHTHALLLSLRFFQILKDPNPRKRRKIEKSDPFENKKKEERKKETRRERNIYIYFSVGGRLLSLPLVLKRSERQRREAGETRNVMSIPAVIKAPQAYAKGAPKVRPKPNHTSPVKKPGPAF